MASNTVLITALGGDIAQNVLAAVTFFSPKSRIIGTDKYPSSAGLFMCQKSFVIQPAAGENPKSFVRRLAKICNDEKVKIVFVCHEAEQEAVARNSDWLRKNTKAYFVVQPLKTLLLCKDKRATYSFLEKKNVRVPETSIDKKGIAKLIKKFGFPLVLKPRRSCGSRDFHIVHSKIELDALWAKIPDALVQEYITNDKDEEYTVGIFLDKNSHALGAIPMLRTLRFGMTWYGSVDEYPDIAAVAIAAAEAVKAIGPCNVQLRRDSENKPCVIEINARISSTVNFRARLGFNEPGAAIDYFINHKKPKLKFKKGMIMRTWSEIVIPLEKYRSLEKNNFLSNE